jgi:hypothetical protein
MNETYYYVADGKSVGPYSIEEIMKHPITPDTYVWTKGLVNWVKLNELPEVYQRYLKKEMLPQIPNVPINLNIMKEYFFLKGKDQNGPFTIEQLEDKGLTSETLIWTAGMESWNKLKDIPELAQAIKPKLVPPPPPSDTEEKISKTVVSGQLKVTTEKIPNPDLEAIKPNKATLTWLIVWCGFHLFALLMSYSQVEIFNAYGKPETDDFWPFVEIITTRHFINPWTMEKTGETATEFNGIFVDYDWTEFAFYVGGAIVIYLLVRISNKDEEKKII